MAKTPQKPKTQSSKTTAKTARPAAPRKLKTPTYQSFRLHKRIKGDALPSAFRLLAAALGILRRNWKVFLGTILIYGVLNAVLVQGFSATGNLNETKAGLDRLLTGDWGQLLSSLTVFTYLLGASGNTASPAAGAYQLILVLIVSLALIWLLRQLYAGHTVRVRDGFYRGMAPLVQFVLVIVVIVLQLIPLALGFLLFNAVVGGGVAVTMLEQVSWFAVWFVLGLTSLYMISSSLFALYIVTLPDMTPLAALRSARQLVANRRWAVMRKVIFLPLALVIIAALLVMPIILFATPLAAIIFYLISMLLLPLVHSYMYALYRAML